MKTIRTILATFGVTSLVYGLFALIAMRLNPAFTGRTIFQLFRDTGFVALVIGIGCVLSFVIMTIAIVSFRDDGGRRKRECADDDVDDFLEEETVPEERADDADETWSPEMKRKQRRALQATDEAEEIPSLFDDEEDDEPERVPFGRPVTHDRTDEPTVGFMAPTPKEDDVPDPEAAVESPFAAQPPKAPVRRETAEEAPDTEEAPEEADEDMLAPAPDDGALKRCIYCGKPIDADSAFCIYCGKRV